MDEALSSFNKAIELRNFDCDIYINKGRCLLRMNKYDEALIVLQEVYNFINKNDKYLFYLKPEIANLIGNILMQQEKYEESILFFDEILKLCVWNIENRTRMNKAITYALHNQIKDSDDMFRSFIDFDYKNPDICLFYYYHEGNQTSETSCIDHFENNEDKDVANLKLLIYQNPYKFQQIYECFKAAKKYYDNISWW